MVTLVQVRLSFQGIQRYRGHPYTLVVQVGWGEHPFQGVQLAQLLPLGLELL